MKKDAEQIIENAKKIREFQEFHEKLKNMFFRQLAEYPIPPYRVVRWGRDCDCCESTSIYTVDTYLDLVIDFVNYVDSLEWAEGPETWGLTDLTIPEGSSQRDRVMEAYENGRGNSIYV